MLQRFLLKSSEHVNLHDHFSRYFMQIASHQQPDVVSGRRNAFFLAEKSMTRPNGNARVANKVLSFASHSECYANEFSR